MPGLIDLLKKWLAESSPRQKLTVGLLIFSLLATGILFMLGSASENSNDPLGSSTLYFFSVFIKLIGVLLLIVGSAVLLKRWMPLGPNGRSANQLRVIETVRLSPRQALHLVVIGEQHLLIGATDQSIALITPVEGLTSQEPDEEAQSQPVLDFGSVLQSLNANLPGDSFKGKG